MKKINFYILHLGYGGIQKCVTSVANILSNHFDIEIISIYKLYNEAPFYISSKVKVTYLIENDIALRVSEYKVLFFNFHWIKLIKVLWNDYLKKGKFKSLLKDGTLGLKMYIDRKKAVINHLKNNKTDYIISTTSFINDLVGEHGKGIKIGWEHNHHQNESKIIKTVVETSKKLDKLIVVSRTLQNFYFKEFKKSNLSCDVLYIPNFINNISHELSDLKSLNIVSVGRLSAEKAYDDLIDVFSIINKENKSVTLEIAGSGPEESKIKAIANQKGLNNFINLRGFLKEEELNRLYKNSSLFLMASKTESFGLVLIEAMNYGVPCIAFSSAEGAYDIIENGKNGYLIENRDIKKMANKALFLLSNKEMLKKLSLNAKESSLKYSKEAALKCWLKMLGE